VLARWRSFWQTLRRRQRFEDDLDEELRFHVESRAADLERAGLSAGEARRRARIELGAVAAHKEEVRQARGVRLLDELAADWRSALRGWRRHWGLALSVTAILTIGIGIATAVFTLVNAELLRARVRHDPGSFAEVNVARAVAPGAPGRFEPPVLEDLLAIEGASRSLAAVAGVYRREGQLGDEPEKVRGALVTCNYFGVHGPVRPRLGRLLDGRDCREEAAVVVLAEDLWRRRGADPAVVGRVVTFRRRRFTVVGVVGALDGGMPRAGLYIPHSAWSGLRGEEPFRTTARLRPGYGRSDAAAELNVLLAQADARHPGRRSQVAVTDGSEIARPGNKEAVVTLALMLGLLAMLLLLVCSNAVSLLLARAHARRHEIAVRLSLGAGRRRLMKMLAVETLPLAAVSGGIGLLIARELPPLAVRYLSPWPRLEPLHPDWRVFLFVAGISLLAALASGLTPALEALRVDLVGALKGRVVGPGGRREPRLQQVLVAGQIAVTLVLLAGGGLFVRAYYQLTWAERGFDARHTLAAPLRARDEDPPSWRAVHAAVAAALRGEPGIKAVAFAEDPPPEGHQLVVTRADAGGVERPLLTWLNGVSPDFFRTLGVPILRGRTFLPGESVGGRVQPVVLSQALARALWGEEDPLGRSLRAPDGRRFDVIGVAGDISGTGEWMPPAFYGPLPSVPGAVLVRFSGDAAAAAARVEAIVPRVAPGILADATSFHAERDKDARTMGRFGSVVFGVAGCALLMALLGIYGTVGFAIRRRTREVGIRMALGAGGREIVRALVSPTAWAVAAGLAVGLTAAFLMTPALDVLDSMLEEPDPLVFTAAAATLAIAALAAMVRPVHRALTHQRLGPATILREE
jgi:predicted permease